MLEDYGVTDLNDVLDEKMFSEVKQKKKMFFYLQERRFLIEVIDEKAYPVPNSKPIISKSGVKVESQK